MASASDRSSDWPSHVAIIMDGNGRWAKKRRLPRLEGHRQGAKSVRRAVEFCRRNGIAFLTLYAFSTENWQRPRSEVAGLMKLLSQFIDSELSELHANGIRVMTIGELDRLPSELVAKIRAAAERNPQERENGSQHRTLLRRTTGYHFRESQDSRRNPIRQTHKR